MSTSPESGSSELGLDLDLHFLPAWAQKPAENQYAKFEGAEESFDRRRSGGDRRERRFDRPPRRGPGGRPQGGPGQGGRGPGGPDRGAGRPRPFDRGRRPERTEPLPPPLEVNVSFIPEEKGVESLARQIRLTGRAYPLFDIAFLILKKPDRYTVRFEVIKKPDGQAAQPLFICALDDTLWLSEAEAMEYVLTKHFTTFYQPERTPTDPPKGTYTFVAQCGMSGTILGPPNYHDYQNKIRKLHTERFSRMPFDAFKARIRIVRDETIVKKWLEDQSWRTEYVCLNLPETVKLASREEVEQHFRQVHLANVIKPVESHTLSGTAAQALPTHALQRHVRRSWDEQMRFPIKVVTVLSQQFASHGLQFFKVSKAVTHVAVARPRYLDPELTPVSDGVRKIVDFIQATPTCTRRKILDALAPLPAQPAPAPGASPAPADAEPVQTPERAAVISDLHWLIHQGHVIEFAKGLIELAKKPTPRPPRPEPKSPAPETQGEAPASPAAALETVTPVPASAEAQASQDARTSEAPAADEPIHEPVPAAPQKPIAEAEAGSGSPSSNAEPRPGVVPDIVEASPNSNGAPFLSSAPAEEQDLAPAVVPESPRVA
jgi:hypothetical protein